MQHKVGQLSFISLVENLGCKKKILRRMCLSIDLTVPGHTLIQLYKHKTEAYTSPVISYKNMLADQI